MQESYPAVSFLMPALNEEHQIARCLDSIRAQDYPQKRIEIVVADAASTDKTVEIAKARNCKVVPNEKKLAEPGCYLAWATSSGTIKFFMAADVELPNKDWLKHMVRPFTEDPDIVAAFTQIIPAPKDNSLNRYYSLLHVEPFSWFIYGDTSNPRRFKRAYKTLMENDGYSIYDYSLKNHPLEALCQGFAVRDDFQRKPEFEYDDVLPVLQMIEERRKIAYVPEAGIYHYHLKGLRDYWKKYGWRIRNSLYESNYGFHSRNKYVSHYRRLRKYLWMLYGLTVILPLIDCLRWYMKDRESSWFWHPVASFILCIEIIFELCRFAFRKTLNVNLR